MGDLIKGIGSLFAAVVMLALAVLLFIPAVILAGTFILGLVVVIAIGYILVQIFIAVF